MVPVVVVHHQQLNRWVVVVVVVVHHQQLNRWVVVVVVMVPVVVVVVMGTPISAQTPQQGWCGRKWSRPRARHVR